jgi:type VII secretion-associated serine protease mycosin
VTARRPPRSLVRRALLAAVAAAALLGACPPARADVVRDAQWHIDDLRLPAAWRLSRGAGVTIAVLDTGVDPRATSLRGKVKTGPDLVKSGARRGDRYWGRHGTDIATIAAGTGPRSGAPTAILGVAPEARILSVRVIAEDEDPEFGEVGSIDGVARAIRYAVDHGAEVINMSFGAGGFDAEPGEPEERAAVRYALARGVVLVASAGNEGDPKSRPRRGRNRAGFPAGYAGVIAVAAVRRDHTVASFSSRHTYVTLGAPGVDIVGRADATFYYVGEGTSQAAAVVSGTVALIRARHPKLSPAQIQRLLVDTASSRPRGGHSGAIGFGVVNPLGALRKAATLTPEPEAPVAPAYDGPRYFGPGPARTAPVAPAGAGGAAPGGRRALLGGLGLVLLLPGAWLLLAGVRAAAKERERPPPVPPGWAVTVESSAAWPAAPAQRQAHQEAEHQRDQQRQPEWHGDHRDEHADLRRRPVLEHEHQRDDRDDQPNHLPPADDDATAPGS